MFLEQTIVNSRITCALVIPPTFEPFRNEERMYQTWIFYLSYESAGFVS